MILIAEQNKVFAYRNENNEEIVLGTEIYLGKNDDPNNYYQIEIVTE